MTWICKAEKAISLAQTLKELDFIENKILTTPNINRRTIKGREERDRLLTLSHSKASELQKNEPPF